MFGEALMWQWFARGKSVFTTSLQHLYNIRNSIGMGVVGRVITPTQS